MRSACSSSNDPTAPPSQRSEAVTPQPARHAPAALPAACGRRRSTNPTDRSLGAAAGCGRRAGAHPAPGRRVTFAMCDLFKFDERGRIVSEDCYQDLLGVLTTLGVTQPPAAVFRDA